MGKVKYWCVGTAVIGLKAGDKAEAPICKHGTFQIKDESSASFDRIDARKR